MTYTPTKIDKEILHQKMRHLHVKTEILDREYNVVGNFAGRLLSDSYSIDANSAIRRTYNMDVLIDYYTGVSDYASFGTANSTNICALSDDYWMNHYVRPSIGYEYDSSLGVDLELNNAIIGGDAVFGLDDGSLLLTAQSTDNYSWCVFTRNSFPIEFHVSSFPANYYFVFGFTDDTHTGCIASRSSSGNRVIYPMTAETRGDSIGNLSGYLLTNTTYTVDYRDGLIKFTEKGEITPTLTINPDEYGITEVGFGLCVSKAVIVGATNLSELKQIGNTSPVKYYTLGNLLFDTVSSSYDAATSKLSFSCLDQMCRLTGDRNGVMKGNGTIIPASNEVYLNTVQTTSGVNTQPFYTEEGIDKSTIIGVMSSILLENGVPLNKQKLTDPSTVEGAEVYVPYDLEFGANTTAIDMITQLRDLNIGWETFFDLDGCFVYQPIPTTADEAHIITYDELKSLIISEPNLSKDLKTIKNCIELYGAGVSTGSITSTNTTVQTRSWGEPGTDNEYVCHIYNGDTLSFNGFIVSLPITNEVGTNTDWHSVSINVKTSEEGYTPSGYSGYLGYDENTPVPAGDLKVGVTYIIKYHQQGFSCNGKFDFIHNGVLRKGWVPWFEVVGETQPCAVAKLYSTQEAATEAEAYDIANSGESPFHKGDGFGYGHIVAGDANTDDTLYHIRGVSSAAEYIPDWYTYSSQSISMKFLGNRSEGIFIVLGSFYNSSHQVTIRSVYLGKDTSVWDSNTYHGRICNADTMSSNSITPFNTLPYLKNGSIITVTYSLEEGKYYFYIDGVFAATYSDESTDWINHNLGIYIPYNRIGCDWMDYQTVTLASGISFTNRYMEAVPTGNIIYKVAPNNPFTIDRIGEVRTVLSGGEYDNIHRRSEAIQRAEYELWKASTLVSSLQLNIVDVPWLDVNQKLSYRSFTSDELPVEDYVIKSKKGSFTDGTSQIQLEKFVPIYPWQQTQT